jgi:hypothetical protein
MPTLYKGVYFKVLHDLSLCQEWQNVLIPSDVIIRNKQIFSLYKGMFITTDNAITFSKKEIKKKIQGNCVLHSLHSSMSLLTQTAKNVKGSQEIILNWGRRFINTLAFADDQGSFAYSDNKLHFPIQLI